MYIRRTVVCHTFDVLFRCFFRCFFRRFFRRFDCSSVGGTGGKVDLANDVRCGRRGRRYTHDLVTMATTKTKQTTKLLAGVAGICTASAAGVIICVAVVTLLLLLLAGVLTGSGGGTSANYLVEKQRII